MALIGSNKNPRQPARQMRPYLTDLDMADGFAVCGASRKDHASVGLLGTLEIAFKLSVGQRVAEEPCAPLNESILGR